MKDDTMFFVILAIAVVLLFSNKNDDQSDIQQRKDAVYCEMVALWEADKAAGKDEFSRDGHPHYNRFIDCTHADKGERQ